MPFVIFPCLNKNLLLENCTHFTVDTVKQNRSKIISPRGIIMPLKLVFIVEHSLLKRLSSDKNCSLLVPT